MSPPNENFMVDFELNWVLGSILPLLSLQVLPKQYTNTMSPPKDFFLKCHGANQRRNMAKQPNMDLERRQ